MNSQEVRILVGLPASGKSTYAEFLLKEEPTRWVRINYDDLRHGEEPDYWVFSHKAEAAIQHKAYQMARAALMAGKSLVIDNTNLSHVAVRRWQALAAEFHCIGTIHNINTPLDECIWRDSLRTGWRRVGRPVIEKMALWYGYIRFRSAEQIILVDVDGTLADNSHRTHHVHGVCKACEGVNPTIPNLRNCTVCNGSGKAKKNWDGFYAEAIHDKPREVVCEWVRRLYDDPNNIICIVSGRPMDKCGEQTMQWLLFKDIPYHHIFMRSAGDYRDDVIIKQEILDHLPKEQVAFAIDDRLRVVNMWRQNGVKVYPVSDGDGDF